MTRLDLQSRLRAMRIPVASYSLEGGFPSEALCLSNNGHCWSVYYSEKGLKTGEASYPNEGTACEAFPMRIEPFTGIS